MSYVIVISNEKGGVAKTTTTFSLGAALVNEGKKVLLIDLDPQGNLTLANGIDSSDIEMNSASILLDDMKARDAVKSTSIPNLDIIPSNTRISIAEQVLPSRKNYMQILKNSLLAKSLDYDYIILDCPPSMGAITTNALTCANLLVIPTQAEYFSAYALRDMMTLIRQIRKETNSGLAYRILITMLDQRNRTHRTIRDQLQQTFGLGLFDAVIEVDTRLRESPIIGVPISTYRPTSRGSIQYRDLAQELMIYVQQQIDTQPAK